MFGAILKAINSFFQKGMTFCRSIYLKKVMKLLAFTFDQPSYDKREEVGFDFAFHTVLRTRHIKISNLVL